MDPALRDAAPAKATRRAARALRRASFEALRLGSFALLLWAVLFNLSVVRGSSMAPGIRDGDHILVAPWSYVFDEVERGDVAVLRYPLDPEVDYIKRVVALAGDRVTMAGGRLWVNGVAVEEPYVEAGDADSWFDVVVRTGHVFVLGDNRARSSDSREFGQVPIANLRGRVDVRVWPPVRAGLID